MVACTSTTTTITGSSSNSSIGSGSSSSSNGSSSSSSGGNVVVHLYKIAPGLAPAPAPAPAPETMESPEAVRIRELEEAVTKLTQKLKKANHSDINRLNEYKKAHPEIKQNSEKTAERKRQYKERHREEILAKRREAYRLKKAGAIGSGDFAPGVSPEIKSSPRV